MISDMKTPIPKQKRRDDMNIANCINTLIALRMLTSSRTDAGPIVQHSILRKIVGWEEEEEAEQEQCNQGNVQSVKRVSDHARVFVHKANARIIKWRYPEPEENEKFTLLPRVTYYFQVGKTGK